MEIECGLYWVKYYDKWIVAELTENNWKIIGEEESVWYSEIDEIGERVVRNSIEKQPSALGLQGVIKVEQRKLLIAFMDFAINQDSIPEMSTAELIVDAFIKSNEELSTPTKSETPVICPECNGEGGFQFSQDPDDCEACPKCNGRG